MYSAPRSSLLSSGIGRIPEFIENLKLEFENLAHDANMYKMQRDDYERKLQAQLTELGNIQQTVFDLERNLQKYEDEIVRLRRQLDLQSSGGSTAMSNPAYAHPSVGGGIGNGMTTSAPALGPLGGSNVPGLSAALGSLGVNPQSLAASSNPSISSRESRPTLNVNTPTSVEKGNLGTMMNNPPNSIFYGAIPPIDTSRSSYSSAVSSPVTNKRKPSPPPPSVSFPPMNPMNAELPSKHHKPMPLPKEHPLTQASVVSLTDQPEDSKFNLNRNIVTKPSPAENGAKDEPSKDKASNGKEDSATPHADWIVGYNPQVQSNLNVDLLHNLEHSSVVCCVRFSNDGKSLATGCNKSAQVYDVESGEKIHLFAEDAAKDGDLYIRSVCFSPDNRYLAAGAEDKTVKVWNVEQKRLHQTLVGHELDIYSVDYSRDGSLMVSGSGDKKAKIWNMERGECVYTLGNEEVGPMDGVTSVAFSPDGRLVAAGSLDRMVRVWDATTGYFLERFEGHMDSVYAVAFSPDGRSLASGSLDKTLKLWDMSGSRSRAKCRSTFTGHKDFVLSVAFSPDGKWLISGSKDRSVQFWDPRTAVTHMMLQGHKNSVINVAVSPLGTHFATGGGDARARIWKYSQ